MITNYDRNWLRRIAPILSTLGLVSGMILGLNRPATATPVQLSDLPVTVTGVSGGAINTLSCGTIPATPDLELNLTEDSYLQVQVETLGDSTIWIDGPLDFCVLRDGETNQLETSGHWPEGLYQIYVGDQEGGGSDFSLTLFE